MRKDAWFLRKEAWFSFHNDGIIFHRTRFAYMLPKKERQEFLLRHGDGDILIPLSEDGYRDAAALEEMLARVTYAFEREGVVG